MSVPLEEQLSQVLLNLQGYSVEYIEKVVYDIQEQIHVHLHSTKPTMCPYCHQLLPIYDTRQRYIYHASILGKPVILVLKLRRTNCPRCGVKTERQDIAEGKKRHSKLLEQTILDYTVNLDNKSTAKLLGYSVSSVYRIDRDGLEKLDEDLADRIPNLGSIGLDEVSYERNHHYATVMTNQDEARIVDIQIGKSKESALTLFRKHNNKFNWLNCVTMDFSQSYISAVSEYFSSSYIVFDKFHFSQYVNRVMEKIRRDIQRELPDDLKYKSKKHSRWLVLRRECNMNQGHKARLEQLKEDNAELFEAYLIKEELLSIFDVDIDTTSAEVSLHNWCRMALNSAFKPFHRLAKSINDRMHLLLHWFRTHVTNAKTEALNNVIKSLLKRAYGYKDFEYFRLKVLQRCGYLMKRLTH